MIGTAQIRKIEGELRLLRNQLANAESQNQILVDYMIEMQKRRRARVHRRDAARSRACYVWPRTPPRAKPGTKDQLRSIPQMAPAVSVRLWDRLQKTL